VNYRDFEVELAAQSRKRKSGGKVRSRDRMLLFEALAAV
jgi:hypothetical protein